MNNPAKETLKEFNETTEPLVLSQADTEPKQVPKRTFDQRSWKLQQER